MMICNNQKEILVAVLTGSVSKLMKILNIKPVDLIFDLHR